MRHPQRVLGVVGVVAALAVCWSLLGVAALLLMQGDLRWGMALISFSVMIAQGETRGVR